jgi:hypothetical protein
MRSKILVNDKGKGMARPNQSARCKAQKMSDKGEFYLPLVRLGFIVRCC